MNKEKIVGTVKTAEEIKRDKEHLALQKKTERVAKAIEVILNKDDLALQPFIMTSEYGIVPRVRLVPVPKENKNGK